MKYYADTSFLISLIRGDPAALSAISRIDGPVVVPSVAYYEFYVGIEKMRLAGKDPSKEQRFIESLEVELPDRAVLQRAAEVRARSEAQGVMAGDMDYIVLEHAVANHGAVITGDTDVKRIKEALNLDIRVILLSDRT